MFRLKFFIISFFVFSLLILRSEAQSHKDLPYSVYSGPHGNHHVQGIAVDEENGFVYFSFTDKLVKTDLKGRLIGSVTGYVGHLGCIDFDPRTHTVYGSLEYKNDAIVQSETNAFYIAMFDGDKITKEDMDGEDGAIMQASYLEEVVKDYEAKVNVNGKEVEHRFGTSGIDGTTLGPEIGEPNSPMDYVYVAYGIYGDGKRTDNDNQVILKYDLKELRETAKALSQENPHRSGPGSFLNKYFVKTGNTRYGVQNLEFDSYTGNFFAAVYRGAKPAYPNYDLFVIDGHKKSGKKKIQSDGKWIEVDTLALLDAGRKDPKTGIRGWYFKYGATGIHSLGDGDFYISHNRKYEGQQETTIYKYKWMGDVNEKTAFELAE